MRSSAHRETGLGVKSQTLNRNAGKMLDDTKRRTEPIPWKATVQKKTTPTLLAP